MIYLLNILLYILTKFGGIEMKKIIRLVCLAFVVCLSLLIFSSCGQNDNTSTEVASDADPFIPIEGQEKNGLVYHSESKTVYVLFKESSGVNSYGGAAVGYGYLAEYIVNGHNCEYIDGNIVEVIPEVIIKTSD